MKTRFEIIETTAENFQNWSQEITCDIICKYKYVDELGYTGITSESQETKYRRSDMANVKDNITCAEMNYDEKQEYLRDIVDFDNELTEDIKNFAKEIREKLQSEIEQ